jgi:hypothetical protein
MTGLTQAQIVKFRTIVDSPPQALQDKVRRS